ncbi:MAG: hypothetical protein JXA45_05885 [Methanomassiliicoccales archaeon]|nr:hypothetical protein [Methanomassiliicoccales archaeon]
MMYMISERQMTLFLTVVAPLMFLLAALIVATNIWVIMMAILWMGVGLIILYIPREEE